MQTPTREEMIRMAEETKKENKQPEVTEEMMAEFPVKMEEWTIPSEEGDIKAYYSEPEQMQNPDVLILNLHGGGFIRSRTENDELFCRRMNHALSCKVLDVDYKIAPYYPFPVALHETSSVLRWVYANTEKLGIDPEKLVIMGHSAGGNLAIGAVMRALEEDMRTPALLISEYPPLDIYTDPAAKKPMGKGIPVERARLYNLFYCDREQQKDPYCSPVYAPNEMLRGFPPSLFITAGSDDLCNEAEDFALRLARCGNEVTVKRFPDAIHAFTIKRLAGHEEACDLVCRFIRGGIKMNP